MSALIPTRPITVALAVLPVSVVAFLAVRFQRSVSSCTATNLGRLPPPSAKKSLTKFGQQKKGDDDETLPVTPYCLPFEVANSEDSEWVVTYECVASKSIPASDLPIPLASQDSKEEGKGPSALMKAYCRAVHLAFTRTPQAFAMRLLVGDEWARRTFDADWIEHLDFKMGDFVNGVYKVTYQGEDIAKRSERVELMIEAPASYKGDVPRGLILAEIRQVGDVVVFVNETWMWRRAEEPLTMLETSFGAWFHALMARWLVFKGVISVIED